MENIDGSRDNRFLPVIGVYLIYMVTVGIYVMFAMLDIPLPLVVHWLFVLLWCGIPLYHFRFLRQHKGERYWYYKHVLVSIVMSCLVCAIGSNTMSVYFDAYEIGGIFLIVSCICRLVYVPLMYYGFWRRNRDGHVLRLWDCYPHAPIVLIPFVVVLGIVLLLIVFYVAFCWEGLYMMG